MALATASCWLSERNDALDSKPGLLTELSNTTTGSAPSSLQSLSRPSAKRCCRRRPSGLNSRPPRRCVRNPGARRSHGRPPLAGSWPFRSCRSVRGARKQRRQQSRGYRSAILPTRSLFPRLARPSKRWRRSLVRQAVDCQAAGEEPCGSPRGPGSAGLSPRSIAEPGLAQGTIAGGLRWPRLRRFSSKLLHAAGPGPGQRQRHQGRANGNQDQEGGRRREHRRPTAIAAAPAQAPCGTPTGLARSAALPESAASRWPGPPREFG